MDKFKYKNHILLISMFALSFVYFKTFIMAEVLLSERLKGKILLQVEKNGEAWYVSPINDERYYLGRPDDAFTLMKNLGLGIRNEDIKKIPIAITGLSGPDGDTDGLPDLFEDAIQTDKNNSDSDNDGFDDKTEISTGYNPIGEGKIKVDGEFSKNLAGYILIQAEQNGEAWYVNPTDRKRYFLGRPKDAFEVMKKTGLGVTNSNLDKIAIFTPTQNSYQNNTIPTSAGKQKYTNTENKYSFEYPDSWIMNKIQGQNEVIAIRNYNDDIMNEKKAMITLAFIEADDQLDLSQFKTASKDGAIKQKTEMSKVNEFESLKETFDYADIGSKETTTYVQLSDNTMLMVTMFSAGNHDNHERIFNDLLRTIETQ